MGEAIDKTSRLYPGLLEQNQNLLFMLKCRQFIEMVNGSDVEVYPKRNPGVYSPTFTNTSPRSSSPIQTSVIHSTKSYSNKSKNATVEELNQNNAALNGNNCSSNSGGDPVIRPVEDSDIEMDTSEEVQNGHTGDSCNGKVTSNSSNGYQNGNSHNSLLETWTDNDDEDMGK